MYLNFVFINTESSPARLYHFEHEFADTGRDRCSEIFSVGFHRLLILQHLSLLFSLTKCSIVNHVWIILPIIAISYKAIEHIIKISEVSTKKHSHKKSLIVFI